MTNATMTNTTRQTLWTHDEIIAATGGQCSAAFAVKGVSIDTRSLAPGDLFVALSGVERDGHAYVAAAFNAGASAALVLRGKIDAAEAGGPVVEVDDVAEALEQIAHASRARSQAYITAVTGSVGKTSVKEALKVALSRSGETFASEKSFNNHIGVPLSLARMPQDCTYAVFEIGMNHAGEIDALVRMVRPHCAVITHIGTAHIEHFNSEADIARAKGEIFNAMANGGTAIIPADSPHVDLLENLAAAHSISDLRSFSLASANVRKGAQKASGNISNNNADETTSDAAIEAAIEAAHIVANTIYLHDTCSCVVGRVGAEDITYKVGTPGLHHVSNSLAVLGAVQAAGGDLALASLSLAEVEALSGRGQRHVLQVAGGECLLIDESYNANPVSMAAAITGLGLAPRLGQGRRIAVLGDMAELGEVSSQLHADLADLMDTSDIDLVFSCGAQMAHMFANLPADRRGVHADTPAQLTDILKSEIHAADVVMIKGSHASQMHLIVERLLEAQATRADHREEKRNVI